MGNSNNNNILDYVPRKQGTKKMTFESKFRNFVGRINNLSKEETIIISRSLLEEFNSERKIVIDSWHGKSSFSISEVGDKIIVTKYQKPEKGAEPKEIKTEIDINDLKILERTIRFYFKNYIYSVSKDKDGNKYFKSTEIGESFYNMPWKEIFNKRKMHNKFTIMLNVLEKKEVIVYIGGRVYLNKPKVI